MERIPTHTPLREYQPTRTACPIPHCPYPWTCVIELVVKAHNLEEKVQTTRLLQDQQRARPLVLSLCTPSPWGWDAPAPPPAPQKPSTQCTWMPLNQSSQHSPPLTYAGKLNKPST